MSNTSKTNNSLPLSYQRGALGRFSFCNTQSYNRYSYVQNNPLKYTDPSGWILKAAPEKVIGDDLSGGGGGGGSRGNIGYVGDLNSITGMGSFGYNYMGSYSAYASNPGGYAATYGTTANWVTSVHQSSSASMPNWDKGNPSTMYHIAKQTIIDINTFNASTRSNTIIPRTGNNEYNGISWNTATACENCGVPNTPTRSNVGNANKGGVTFEQARLWYQFGGGTPMKINLNTIDFSRVSMSEMKGKLIEVNLDNPFKHMTNVNDALVYGTLYLYQEKGNAFRSAHVNEINGRGDYYNFDVKWTDPKAWLFRNENTMVGGLINGLMTLGGSFMYMGGTPYPIYLHGTVTIKP